MHRLLWTLFGISAGGVYALLFQMIGSDSPRMTTALGAAVMLLFAICYWRASVSSKFKSRYALVAPIFTPLLVPLAACAAAFAAILVVLLPFLFVSGLKEARRMRKQMKARGRYLTSDELQFMPEAPGGTFIAETAMRLPFRVWWTRDDLAPLGTPASTPEDLAAIANGAPSPFNARCIAEYLDDENGKAYLTSMTGWAIKTGKLARMFPRTRVVTVLRPSESSQMKKRLVRDRLLDA